MNKFSIGDLIYLPQGTLVCSEASGDAYLWFANREPTVATYLGKLKDSNLHKIDAYTKELYLSSSDIEVLNFARK